MATSRRGIVRWALFVSIVLVIANGIVAVFHVGRAPGVTYRWICRDSQVELIYRPSVFGGSSLSRGNRSGDTPRRWELIEPRPPSPYLPWNWLALAIQSPTPDPEAVIQKEGLETASPRDRAADR